MTFPSGALSSFSRPAEMLPPDDRPRSDLLQDFEMGGISVGNASQGLRVQVWRAYLSGSTIWIVPESGGTSINVTSDTDITELTLAFDQNMRPTVVYVANEVTKLYWYDPIIGSQTTQVIPDCASPFLTMDDKRELQNTKNDILLFYLNGLNLCYREQRERFLIEHVLTTLPPQVTRIARVGMNKKLCVQIDLLTSVNIPGPPTPPPLPGPPPLTLDPVKTSSGATLSDGNLTFFASGDSFQNSLITRPMFYGKKYCEISIVQLENGSDGFIGIASISTSGNYNASIADSRFAPYVQLRSNGVLYTLDIPNGTAISGGNFAAGDVMMIAVDLDAKKMWVGKNNVWFLSGNPASGVNPTFFPLPFDGNPSFFSVSTDNNNGSVRMTMRLAADSFQYTPPTGYSALV